MHMLQSFYVLHGHSCVQNTNTSTVFENVSTSNHKHLPITAKQKNLQYVRLCYEWYCDGIIISNDTLDSSLKKVLWIKGNQLWSTVELAGPAHAQSSYLKPQPWPHGLAWPGHLYKIFSPFVNICKIKPGAGIKFSLRHNCLYKWWKN